MTKTKTKTKSRHVAIRLDGSRTVHTSAQALESARRRAVGERVIVSSWPESDPPPGVNDAQAWDDWRLRRGIAS